MTERKDYVEAYRSDDGGVCVYTWSDYRNVEAKISIEDAEELVADLQTALARAKEHVPTDQPTEEDSP